MSYVVTQQDIDVIFQKQKSIYAKIELLNKDLLTVDELQGVITSGDFGEDATSDIRRNGTLTLLVRDSSFIVGENSKLWMDKHIRIWIGIFSIRANKILWYNMGLYLFNELSYKFDEVNKSLTVSFSDMMCNLTGLRNGQLASINSQISLGVSIRQALVDTITQLGGVKKYIVDDVIIDGQSATVPYDLKFSSGETVYGLVSKLRDLYPAYETYFDIDGNFVFKKIPTGLDENIVMDDAVLQQILISEDLNVDFNSVKNSVVVYGWLKDDGVQIKGSFKDENPDSPFNITKLGEITLNLSDDTTNRIPTNDLANQRAEYECWLHTRLQDKITLSTLIVPWLTVNTKVQYTPRTTGITSQYIIKKINRDFASGIMTIEMIKFYPLYPFIIS